MVEGAASLFCSGYGVRASGVWKEERQSNMLDGGSHFYGTYETSDGEHVVIGPIEPQFYAEFLDKLGLDAASLPKQMDRESWSQMRERIAAVFRTKTRDEWGRIFAESDACVAPVLRMSEAIEHPHNVARESFVDIEGVVQPGAVPKFSRTKPGTPNRCAFIGEHTIEILSGLGLSDREIANLTDSGAAKQR